MRLRLRQRWSSWVKGRFSSFLKTGYFIDFISSCFYSSAALDTRGFARREVHELRYQAMRTIRACSMQSYAKLCNYVRWTLREHNVSILSYLSNNVSLLSSSRRRTDHVVGCHSIFYPLTSSLYPCLRPILCYPLSYPPICLILHILSSSCPVLPPVLPPVLFYLSYPLSYPTPVLP